MLLASAIGAALFPKPRRDCPIFGHDVDHSTFGSFCFWIFDKGFEKVGTPVSYESFEQVLNNLTYLLMVAS